MIKPFLMTVLVLCALLLAVSSYAQQQQQSAATTAPGGSLEGHWRWDFDVNGQTITWDATVTKKDDKYTGTATTTYDDYKFDLKDVKLDGDAVTFTCERTGDFEIHFAYKGKLEGDKITGNADLKMADQDAQPWDWKATRVKDAPPTTKPAM